MRCAWLLLLVACHGAIDGPSSPDDAARVDEPTDAARIDAAAVDATVDAAPPAPDATVDARLPDARPPDGRDQTVALFSGAHVYFGAENRRQLDAAVELPAADAQYRNLTLTLALRCPGGGCDWWDRHGHLSIMAGDREVEILRFVTPYRLPLTTTLDVTDLRPLLTGRVTARVFIDTWVGPGHANGAGWLVDATLRYTGGAPPRDVLAVLPLWSPGGVVYGDPGRDPRRTATARVPAGATGGRLWTIVTGHGQGNAANCAEFCPKDHTVTVGAYTRTRRIWRDDCRTTAVPNQPGTWTLDRAGWCPGAGVTPWIEDAGALRGGDDVTVAWAPAGYANSCRPGVPTCTGCTLGTGCDYDGGNHTEPHYQLSALLVVYR